MKPTPQAIENAARKICQSGKFETGQGTCAVLCMDQLGDVRKKGCGHCVRVHGKLAEQILSCDLGDMVLVPRDAVAAIRSMLTIEAIAPAVHDFEREKRQEAWDKISAMLPAAEKD